MGSPPCGIANIKIGMVLVKAANERLNLRVCHCKKQISAAYFFSRSRYPIQLRIPPSPRAITAPIIGPDLLAKIASPIPYIYSGTRG
jgi:hypothetical protein